MRKSRDRLAGRAAIRQSGGGGLQNGSFSVSRRTVINQERNNMEAFRMRRILYFTAAFAALTIGTEASAQSLCGRQAVQNFEAICGMTFTQSQCGSEADAKIAIDWVLFEDAGALATYSENVKACQYQPNSVVRHALMAVLHAQRHNKDAMCNLFSCANEMTFNIGAYLQSLAAEHRIPNGYD